MNFYSISDPGYTHIAVIFVSQIYHTIHPKHSARNFLDISVHWHFESFEKNGGGCQMSSELKGQIIISFLLSSLVLSCPVLPLFMSFPVLSFPFLSRNVLSSPFLVCPGSLWSFPIISYPSCTLLSFTVLFCPFPSLIVF